MKKKQSFKKKCCHLVVLLFLFAVYSNNLYATNSSPENQQESKVRNALEFSFMKDGKSVSLSDFPNQYKVINFWSSSSQESRKVNAELVKLEKKYPNSKVVFVDASIDENAKIAEQYGISSAPTLYIISLDGCVSEIKKNVAELEESLDKLLK